MLPSLDEMVEGKTDVVASSQYENMVSCKSMYWLHVFLLILYLQSRKEDRAKGSISLWTYHNYFKAGGGILQTFGMLFIFVIAEVGCKY